ncbi:MAG: hypothetical protein K5668_02915 [Lachnospiraceae bacterium]|nr:hypothetical protein [Lachnospiraceae bacterium]
MNIRIRGIGEFNIGDDRKTVDKRLREYAGDDRKYKKETRSTFVRNKGAMEGIVEAYFIDNRLAAITVDKDMAEDIPECLQDISEAVPYCMRFGEIDFDRIKPNKCRTDSLDYCKSCSLLYTYYTYLKDDKTIMFYKHTENLYPETVTLRVRDVDKYDHERIDEIRNNTLA